MQFAGIQGEVRNSGGWTSTNGSKDIVTTVANNPLGGPGRGFRHFRGDGRNNGGGGLRVELASGQSRVWMRFYMRYMQGFNYKNGQPQYTKEIYWDVYTGNLRIIGFSGGFLYTHVSTNSSEYNVHSTATWHQINGGATGDGQWHCYEQSMNLNGQMEMWIDDLLVLSRNGINFGTALFRSFAIGENQNEVDNDGDGIGIGDEAGAPDGYTDYDDIAVSTTGRIGCL